ncbi:MAG: hypothetical protein B7Y83_01365 [Flavobacteriales bacterium 32-34-25]|nr:MAG: hypothetical protein B7Y83_01365 [Flavobacteriales bacterium 32-34-25]
MDLFEMKKLIPSKKMICSFFGHKIITSRNITNHLKEYKCTVCNMELTNDEEGSLTFLTPELKEVNEALVNFYQKKLLVKQH